MAWVELSIILSDREISLLISISDRRLSGVLTAYGLIKRRSSQPSGSTARAGRNGDVLLNGFSNLLVLSGFVHRRSYLKRWLEILITRENRVFAAALMRETKLPDTAPQAYAKY